METNQYEGSREDADRLDPENDDDIGTGRSYECVFCKRGFTTAQALGGHMNIHRKERSAKPRPVSVSDVPSVSKVNEDFLSFRPNPSFVQSYPPPSQHHHHYAMGHHEVHINYETFFPQSSSRNTINRPSSHTNYGGDVCVPTPQNLNLFGEDWQRSLSLRIGPSCAHDYQDKVEDCSEDVDLDLELRLGHDP